MSGDTVYDDRSVLTVVDVCHQLTVSAAVGIGPGGLITAGRDLRDLTFRDDHAGELGGKVLGKDCVVPVGFVDVT